MPTVRRLPRILESSFGGTDTYLRVNTLRTTAGQLIESLRREQVEAEQVEGMPNTLRVAHSGALEHLLAYREGLFHVQGIPSQICAALLDVRPGMRVADVCAAPGGKSFTLAQMMENQGHLASFDLHPHRINLIKRGAQRLGIGIIRAAVRDAESQQAEEDLLTACCATCRAPGWGILPPNRSCDTRPHFYLTNCLLCSRPFWNGLLGWSFQVAVLSTLPAR